MRLRRRHAGAPPKKRRRIRKLRFFALTLVLLLLASASFTYGMVTAVANQAWKLEAAHQQATERNSIIYDRDHKRILAVLRGSQNRVIVSSDQIAPIMKQAIVAVEDRRFWEHDGVDFRAIARAFWADVQHKQVVEGGSTITQQYIKNAYVDNSRSIARKLKEAILARQLDQRWSKDRILTEYLNTIYFGNGAYGIEQAARTYFQHSAAKLTLPEAALLAALPSDPAAYDPASNPGAAKRQRNIALRLMRDQALITKRQYLNSIRHPLPTPDDIKPPGSQSEVGQYFTNYVKQQLIDKYGTARVFGGGLRVNTTIDLSLQKVARQAIDKWLTDPKGPTAALVAIDPRTGDVLAMVGGKNFRQSQFNLAVQGERQPGSSFKPFVLADALDQGIAPETTFPSKPVDIPFDNKIWHVTNYEGDYLGSADLRTATTYSDNSVYAQLTATVGPASVARMAHRLGIKSPLNSYLSIGLGAEAVNPLEMARAYATFAHGGERVDGYAFGNEPRAIKLVGRQTKTNGKIELLDQNGPVYRQVLDPAKNALLTSILQTVIQSGTGKAAQLGGSWSTAGKTGTTENHGDAWFVGYTPQLVSAVWVGYPNTLRPMLTEYHGKPVAGGTYPALIWKSFMLNALKERGDTPAPFPSASGLYASPSYVIYRDGQLERDNGICKGAFKVWTFSEGGPSRTADCRPNEVQVPNLIGVRRTAAVSRLQAQPLKPLIVYKAARPLQWPNSVVAQIPSPLRRLAANDVVTLVLAKPLHGIVPRVVGLPLNAALPKLEKLKLSPNVRPSDAPSSRRVLRQSPRPGVAAAPGMTVKLVVRGG